MTDLTRLADLAEILGALFVIGGLIFAVLQMRQFKQQRREMAAIELFRFFGRPDFSRAYLDVLNLPDGLSFEAMRRERPDVEASAMLIATTMENIGVMTFERIVPFRVVNHLVGSSTIVLWQKLMPWVSGVREQMGQPYAFEWFQWLADRLEHQTGDEALPAYEAFVDWKPKRLTDDD